RIAHRTGAEIEAEQEAVPLVQRNAVQLVVVAVIGWDVLDRLKLDAIGLIGGRHVANKVADELLNIRMRWRQRKGNGVAKGVSYYALGVQRAQHGRVQAHQPSVEAHSARSSKLSCLGQNVTRLRELADDRLDGGLPV